MLGEYKPLYTWRQPAGRLLDPAEQVERAALRRALCTERARTYKSLCLLPSSSACEEVSPVSVRSKGVSQHQPPPLKEPGCSSASPLNPSSWNRQCFRLLVFVNSVCVAQADVSAFSLRSSNNLKDYNRIICPFGWCNLGENSGALCVPAPPPPRLRHDEDYLTGHLLCALPGPACGCFAIERAENIESAQRREAAQKSETRLDVEPVLPAGGVHRQRLPVHRQGKTSTQPPPVTSAHAKSSKTSHLNPSTHGNGQNRGPPGSEVKTPPQLVFSPLTRMKP